MFERLRSAVSIGMSNSVLSCVHLRHSAHGPQPVTAGLVVIAFLGKLIHSLWQRRFVV